jgi:hypothetical protein
MRPNMTTDIGSKWPTGSDRKFWQQIRLPVPGGQLFLRPRRPRLLSLFGWCTVLGFAAVQSEQTGHRLDV